MVKVEISKDKIPEKEVIKEIVYSRDLAKEMDEIKEILKKAGLM